MFEIQRRVPCTAWGAIALWATAMSCSLQVPSAEEVFGGSVGGSSAGAAGGGNSNAGQPGSAGEAGAAGAAGLGSTEEAGAAGAAGLGSAGAAGEEGIPEDSPPAVLLVHYDFEEIVEAEATGSAGAGGASTSVPNVVPDVSGNGYDATIEGLTPPVLDTGVIGQGIRFDPTQQQFVAMPANILVGLEAVSVTAWLYRDVDQVWARLFDFNSVTANYFYFAPTGWNFDVGAPGANAGVQPPGLLETRIQLLEIVPVGGWHHIAVLWYGSWLRVYFDGVVKKEEVLALPPPLTNLGATSNNWIGKSAFAADPTLDGMVDDFRIYSGILTREELDALVALGQ